MKTYDASQELIDILLSHGFTEDTPVNYPEHVSRLKNGTYNPHGMKRHFAYPGTREKIYFDYINMRLPTGADRYSISTDELKSMIAFCRLSSADRSALVREQYNALSIPEIIANVERAPFIYSKVVYKRAKLKFETITDIN